jgi:tetratricopeptide (TPR) repeat protein
MPTQLLDTWGVPTQASNPAALGDLDGAILSLVSMRGDPPAEAAAAAVADDDLLLAAIAHAHFTLYATSDAGIAKARSILHAIEPRMATAPDRERLHFAAASAWADGRWDLAARRLDEALVRHPRDLLALRVAQDLYYFLGDSRDLRDVAARVIGAWSEDLPGWAWAQGIYAFGLEEAGDYRRAEAAARSALATNPRDIWASHALAHVFEMEGRQEEGIAFLGSTVDDWQDSYFANHNWIHKALYHIELGDFDALVPLYDQQIRGTRQIRWVPVVDSAGALWRLTLFGVDVRERAQALVEGVRDLLSSPIYVFNDWHALMIFGIAGRQDLVKWVLDLNRGAAPGTTNYDVLQTVGLDVLGGFAAFSAGDYETAVDRLITARPHSQLVGGSHAQRDAIDLTALAAASRLGDEDLVRALLRERTERKPSTRLAAEALIAAGRTAV